jgi:hypothetical protein
MRNGGDSMKITSIVVRGEVALSKDFQSAKAGFEAHVELEEGENPKTIHRRVYESLSELALDEARQKLERILTGGA